MLSKSIGVIALSLAILSGQSITPIIASAQSEMPVSTSEIFLIKIQFRGGMRVTRTVPELMIRPNGVYRYSNGVNTPKSGLLSDQELSLLQQRVKQTNFKGVKSKPFRGTCPIAYDGIEMVYFFQSLSGVEEISACKYSISGKSPLFQQLNRLSQDLAAL
jgi:hypothetical protein